jgi:hypothetical protein
MAPCYDAFLHCSFFAVETFQSDAPFISVNGKQPAQQFEWEACLGRRINDLLVVDVFEALFYVNEQTGADSVVAETFVCEALCEHGLLAIFVEVRPAMPCFPLFCVISPDR